MRPRSASKRPTFWANEGILRGIVDKIGAGEFVSGSSIVHRSLHWNAGDDIVSLASRRCVSVGVACVGDDGQIFAVEQILHRFRDRMQHSQVVDLVGHGMMNDDAGVGIDRDLDVVRRWLAALA